MSARWLTHYYNSARRLRYDDATGAHTELAKDKCPPEALDPVPGFFVEAEGRLFGVCPSANGPIFFRDDETFPLAPGRFDARLESTGAKKTFRLAVDGVEVIAFEFDPESFDRLDFWSGEDDEFFDWFCDLAPRPRFHEQYTIK